MEFERALLWSRYAQRAIAAAPELVSDLAATLETPFDVQSDERDVAKVVATGDSNALSSTLRHLRRRVFLHTMARDLTGRADLGEVVGAISRLAECAIAAAVSLEMRDLCASSGNP